MKTRDPLNPGDAAFDKLDEKIRQALMEEGVIIPETIEEVRQAKARLKARPVTVPPHLRDPAVISKQLRDHEPPTEASLTPVVNVCAGDNERNIPQVRHKKGSIFFRRAAFDAYVIHALADDENLGRTKIEKITHLTEYHCGIDFEREPVRDAAGPVDYYSRRKVESLASKQGWYSAAGAENRLGVKYVPGPNILAALPIATRTLGIHKAAVDALIELMRPLDTTRCEIAATLYAAWNDLLLAGEAASDEKIMREARENWHPNKLRIPLERWKRALAWMREQHLVPRGTGKAVPPAH
jgi:hypothetical protein